LLRKFWHFSWMERAKSTRRQATAFALILLVLSLSACGRPSRHAKDDPRDELKHHAVSTSEVEADPGRAAQKAIKEEDWRLISRGPDNLPGLVCSVPSSVREAATVSYFSDGYPGSVPDDPRWKRGGSTGRSAIAAFNRIVAAAPESPWRGLCVDQTAWHSALPPEPWSLLQRVPPSRGARLVETIRLGAEDPPALDDMPHWDGDERDLFGMTALSWAVVRGSHRHLAWMTEGHHSDLDNWCALARRDRVRIPRAWHHTDPLVLVVERKDPELIALLLPVRSERSCWDVKSHPLFQEAWSRALKTQRHELVEPMLRELAVPDQERQSRLAMDLYRAGFGRVAADFLYGPQRLDDSLPLAALAKTCVPGETGFWLTQARRRGRQAEIDFAWKLFNRESNWRDPKACLATMEHFIRDGARIPAGSALLTHIVSSDVLARRGNGLPVSPQEAEAIVAAFRRAGGDPAAPVSGGCGMTPRRQQFPPFCTPAELAELEPTAFRDVLPQPRSLAERYVYDARMNAELVPPLGGRIRDTIPKGALIRPMERELRPIKARGCLVTIEDPRAMAMTASCLARGHKPKFIRQASARSIANECHVDLASPQRDQQLAACRARLAQPISFH
jgi:hypothetical protein